MKRTLHLTILTAALAFFAVANPTMAVVVDATGALTFEPNQSSYLFSPGDFVGFDPSGSDKLVVTVSSEKQGGGTASISGIEYDGVALTEAAQFFSSVSNQLTGIFFIDNPGALGNLEITYSSGQNGVGVSVLALSEIEAGVAVTSGNDGQSTSLTTLTDNSFLVASHVNNGSSGTAQSPLTALLDGNSGSSGAGSGFQQVVLAGLVTPTFTGNNTRPVTVAAAFETAASVPEPATATLALVGLGGLVMRRRRNVA